MTHLGDLVSASPCNSVLLCAAAIAFPSNTRNAPGNESGLGERRSREEREERREKEETEREEKGGADEVVEERETQGREKKKLRRRPIDELREFAGWSSPIGFGSPQVVEEWTVQYQMDSRTREWKKRKSRREYRGESCSFFIYGAVCS